MADIELPGQEPLITGASFDVRRDLAEMAKTDLYLFNTVVLGYKDMRPQCHGPLCLFYTDNRARFKILLMPRDHFKTSAITIGGTLQRVVRNPDTRNLIANESATNAERMLRAIRQHAESNRVFRALYPEVIPKDTKRQGIRWNDSELDFNRTWIGPEPTIDTIGMTGAFTSRHYTDITADDPISEEAVKSPKVMEDTINRFKGFLSLLVKPEKDTITLVGTRWALHDIYSWAAKNLAPQVAIFGRSAITADGTPLFPELMSLDLLAMKRSALGEYKFSCLYLNNPRDESIQDLNVQDLMYWRYVDPDETWIEMYNVDGQVIRRVHIGQLDITTTVDLAPAETGTSDRNVVCTVGVTPWGEALILDMWAQRCSPGAVIEYIFRIHYRYRPRVVGIEGVAYQKAFKWFVSNEMTKRGDYFTIKELKAVGKKEVRIRGLQPLMAAHRIFMHPTQQLMRNEMADFPLGEHDDTVDALSMQQQLWLGIMSPEQRARNKREQDLIVMKLLHPNEDPDELLELQQDPFTQLMFGTQQSGVYMQ